MAIVAAKYSGRFISRISVGNAVCKDDTLCRISVYGIKLKITSPCDGIVTKIFPASGANVMSGDPLFDIKEPAQATPVVTVAAGGLQETEPGDMS